MSRYCVNKNAAPKIEATELWREKCLLANGAIFTDEKIWTPQNIKHLITYFVDNLDMGEGDYYEKLNSQLAPMPPGAIKLASEMHWFMYLCPSNFGAKIKRKGVLEIWSWSGQSLDDSHDLLSDEILDGIGSAGVSFNLNRWREFVYFINVVKTFKALDSSEQNELLSNCWEFAAWLEAIPDGNARQLRTMILYLMYPDNFERVFGGTDRAKIVAHYQNMPEREAHAMSRVRIDKALLEIRKDIENQLSTDEFDFYQIDIKSEWQTNNQESNHVVNNSAVLPDNIRKENVLEAIYEIDREGVQASAQSVYYDLVYNNKYYPPKLVLSLANKYANGNELNRKLFDGGENTTAFKLLRDLGFAIERKDFHGYFLQKFIVQAYAETDQTTRHYIKSYRDLAVKVSFGQGGFAKIPWVSLLAEGQTTSNGIYPVFLYYKDLDILVLAKGISETHVPDISWPAVDSNETVNDYLVRLYNTVPERYGDSYVYKAYKVTDGVLDGYPASDLDELIDEYTNLMGDDVLPITETVPVPVPIQVIAVTEPDKIADDFAVKLRNSNIDFATEHVSRVRAFVASLLTKPFVILTGLSGSGKTQIAIRFGEWLGVDRLHVAAVRPDWTGAEALFGYEDALRPAIDGRSAWAVTGPMAFFLKASADPQRPYVLLLDEMNLAHVERYFADVLSGMESGQPCLPNLVYESDGNWRVNPNGPAQIVFPNNVFVIGTVNVDETTYMFSPKVLDRANTFEFRVRTEDLTGQYLKPVACEQGDLELIQGFITVATDSDWHNNQPYSKADELSSALRNIHQLLSPHGFEFGHRVYYESQRFATLYEAAGSPSIEDALDRILLQKILPRLHGSRRRLEVLIKELAQYCYDLSMPFRDNKSQDVIFEPESKDEKDASLPNSFEKLTRMLRSLRANQFTSFTE